MPPECVIDLRFDVPSEIGRHLAELDLAARDLVAAITDERGGFPPKLALYALMILGGALKDLRRAAELVRANKEGS